MNRRLNFGDWLTLSALRVPETLAVVCDAGDGCRLTFSEIDERARKLAAALQARGVRQHDRIALLGRDCHRYVEAMFACFRIGAVVVPMNSRLAVDEIVAIIRVARPVGVFFGAEYREAARAIQAAAPVQLSVAFDEAREGDHALEGEDDHESLIRSADAHPERVDIDDEDTLVLAFTSGTTGAPKAVMQPQRMLKNLTLQQLVETQIGSDEYSYHGSPLFHMFGRSGLFNGIVRGYPSLLMPSFDPARVLRHMVTGRLTHCAFVPTMISMLLDEGADAHEYPALRRIYYGAAPMTPALLRRVIDVFGCDLINGFGAGTEVGSQATLTADDHRRAAAGATHLLESIGRPALGVDLRLVDEDMNDVDCGEIGEIVTRSEWMMTGYLDMEAETNARFRDGWFCAGDLATADENGYLYLAGRRDDMIIRGGQNIYPNEIENVLSDAPGVQQAAVVGVQDERWGEVVWAFVEADPEAVDPDTLRALCRSRLASYKVPAVVRIVPALPLGATGKIDKKVLKKLAAGELGPPV